MDNDIKESYKKMIQYKIPKDDAKEIIKNSFNCIGKFYSTPYFLNQAYKKIEKENLEGEKALSEIEKTLEEQNLLLNQHLTNSIKDFLEF